MLKLSYFKRLISQRCDAIKIHNPKLAQLLCKTIPARCQVEIPNSPYVSASLSSYQPQQASPSPSAVGVRESSATKQPHLNLFIDSEQYTNLEQLLKQSIGPIAPTILQKAVKEAANYQELVESLAVYLLPQQQKQFQKQAIVLLETLNVSSDRSVQSSTHQVIDANFIIQCERELAYSIGPIAKFLIKQVLQSHPEISLPEFVRYLAKEIPEPKLSIEFERRLLGQ